MCVCKEKRTKADKAQRQADLLDKKSSHRPPQNQGQKTLEIFNQAAVRKVEEAAETQPVAKSAPLTVLQERSVSLRLTTAVSANERKWGFSVMGILQQLSLATLRRI